MLSEMYNCNNMRAKIIDDGENVGYTFLYKKQRLIIMLDKARPISVKPSAAVLACQPFSDSKDVWL